MMRQLSSDTQSKDHARENHIVASLPPADYERLAPHLEQIELSHGQMLYETDGRIEHVYFPINMMTSLVSQLSDGSSVEVGVVGFEGMVGLPLVLGVDKSPHETMAQIPGAALQMKAEVLKAEFKRGGALHDSLLRYTQNQMLQTSQVAACNRLHTVEERLARWLLMSHDRVLRDRLPLTHEFLSMMLGIRRAGVTTAALALQADELIRYRRGSITIVDRLRLEDFACECYRIVKTEFDRLLDYRIPQS